MKSTFLYLLLLVSVACNKPHTDSNKYTDHKLIARWRYVEQYMSTGGPGVWTPIAPAGQTIELKKSGKFIGSQSFLNEAERFEILDSARVRISPVTNTIGYVTMGYRFADGKEELQLFPIEPGMCIEGCNSKFLRG